jgi:hypothetical protein
MHETKEGQGRLEATKPPTDLTLDCRETRKRISRE